MRRATYIDALILFSARVCEGSIVVANGPLQVLRDVPGRLNVGAVEVRHDGTAIDAGLRRGDHRE